MDQNFDPDGFTKERLGNHPTPGMFSGDLRGKRLSKGIAYAS